MFRAPHPGRPAARVAPRRAGTGQAKASRYAPQIPQAVTTAFVTHGQGAAEPGRAAVRRRG